MACTKLRVQHYVTDKNVSFNQFLRQEANKGCFFSRESYFTKKVSIVIFIGGD